jgi:hypothetical protein
MERIDLVVPSELVGRLVIPPLAVTDGTADPEWADVPMSRWRFRRRPSMRLPLDPRAARSTRWFVRAAPWSALPVLAGLGALAAWDTGHLPLTGGAAPVMLASIGVSSLLNGRGLPEQVPLRTRSGDVRLPAVPLRVAHEWVAANPGVIATDEPAPRAHSPRFYAWWCVGLVVAGLGLGAVLAGDGREDPDLLWLLAAGMFVVGLPLAWKIAPPLKPGETPD